MRGGGYLYKGMECAVEVLRGELVMAEVGAVSANWKSRAGKGRCEWRKSEVWDGETGEQLERWRSRRIKCFGLCGRGAALSWRWGDAC